MKQKAWIVLVAVLMTTKAKAESRFGVVKIQGKAPKPIVKAIHLDKEACGKVHRDESLLLGPKGALANAVVTWGTLPLEGGGKGGGGQTLAPVTLIQRGCSYDPHIIVVYPGQPLIIVNSDPVLHTTGFTTKRNRAKTAAQPKGAEPMTVTFVRPEAVRLYCDVHAWMDGWVYVTEAENFRVTGKDGKFSLDGIPSGTKLSIWHEKLGGQEVEVGEGPLEVLFPLP